MAKYDEAYKQLFQHPEFIQQLIEGFAPPKLAQQLDFATLRNHSGEYITPSLKKKTQDLVWSARLRPHDDLIYLYILLEFQSSVDHSMPVRMLHYVAALYDQLIKNKQLKLHKDRLPLVFPLVLYSGENTWRAQLSLQELLPRVPGYLRKYQPQLDYYLIDEVRLNREVLGQQGSILANLLATRNAENPQDWQFGMERLFTLFNQHPQSDLIRRSINLWLRNELKQRNTPDILEFENWLMEVNPMARTTFDDWKQEWHAEGVLEGIKEGLHKGLNKGRSQTLHKQLTTKFVTIPDEYQQRLEQANMDELDVWTERILFAETLEDVFRA